MNLNKNDLIELKIDSMTSEGNGVGKTDEGVAVFVPLSAVGDRLEVRIVKVKKTYAFGKIERILQPSKDRIDVDCKSFNQCGGCVYRHISYEAEKKIKEQKVFDALTRIGGLENFKFNNILSCENSDRYRNKAQFPVGVKDDGQVCFGFYAFHSHRIVECGDCRLQPEIFTQVCNVVKEFMEATKQSVYSEVTKKGKLRHLYIRYGEKTNELMVCLVVNGNGLKSEDVLVKMLREKFDSLKCVVINLNREDTNVILGKKSRVAFGKDFIFDELCGLKFKISPLSFFQVNRSGAELLYNKAKEYAQLKGDEVLLDLFCGTGTIGLCMADKCKKLIGVEVVSQAVEDAKINALENNITNAEFVCGDAQVAVQKLESDGVKPDVVVVDPPRKGLELVLIDTIVSMNPLRVVYVSCDPATLARDLKLFEDKGYKTQEVTPVDMFSRTSHVETVVLMSKV